ncbi:MAG: biopolymer transporter ExbD [Bacteroidales bacterium]|nr:biopolymer transporter ExbD [Bacteroidales bacterium]MCF8391164.1 biopolymer transporter ExbD [Bacteroidales bacterium]
MARRGTPEINAGSMADIAFLLLIFFLVATTMDVDTGISRLLPPIPEDQEDVEIDVRERNVLVVLINRDDQLMVGGELMDLPTLKEKTLEFFSNPTNAENLPEMKEVDIIFPPGTSASFPDGNATFLVSQGVISLQNDRSTTYGKYLQVQDVLVAAVNELRDQCALDYFGRHFDDLNPLNFTDAEIIEGIRKIYKMNISEAEPKNIGGN